MRPQKRNIVISLLAAIIILSVLVVNSRSLQNRTRLEITDSTVPFLKSVKSLLSFPKNIMPFFPLREENKALRDKASFLARKIDEMKSVSEENGRLKDLLELKKALPYATIPAEVIGRDPSNWSNSIIINKGYSSGIRANKAALSYKGLVGRVVEAGRISCKILLISDPNSKVGVIVTRNRDGGILVGMPDGGCKIVYLALDSDVARGDKVVTAGFGSIFPKDILIGEITDVYKEPGRLYKCAIVRTSQGLSKIEEVLCVK